MCEIMTIAAAVIFTLLFVSFRKRGSGTSAVFAAMLMFWGAALMWAVDGIASVIQGEPFFDISMEDTILGFIILATGLAIFAVLALIGRAKKSANRTA